jgi:hypothetical protein
MVLDIADFSRTSDAGELYSALRFLGLHEVTSSREVHGLWTLLGAAADNDHTHIIMPLSVKEEPKAAKENYIPASGQLVKVDYRWTAYNTERDYSALVNKYNFVKGYNMFADQISLKSIFGTEYEKVNEHGSVVLKIRFEMALGF